MRMRFTACALALAVAGVAGCGDTSGDDQRIAELEARVEAAEDRAAAAQVEAEDVAGEMVEDEPADPGCIKVPDVVGKDHQLAQDTMQAAGLYYLDEEDASGQGRMLLLDRNWTTVKQRPKAGACVSEDTEIMLYAVKDGERGG
jgi:hypothetical protein